jgi:hypothetical protein
MLFEDVTLLLLWISCTYFVVQVALGIHDALTESTNNLEKELHKQLDDIIHRVRVEKYDGIYYWYDADDSEFLAQGTNDAEIIAVLKSRFSSHIFYLPTNHFISAGHDWIPTLAPGNLPNRIDSINQK